MQQRSELRRLFKESRNSAGSRALMSMMRELGHQIGRFKVRSLMKEVGLVSKQPGAHRYVSIHRNSIDTGKMRRSSLDPTFLLA